MNDIVVVLLIIAISLVIVILVALLIQNTHIRKVKLFPIKTRITGNEETISSNQLSLKLIDKNSTNILANIPLSKAVSIGRGDLVDLNIGKYLANPRSQHRHVLDFGLDDQGHYVNVLYNTTYRYGNDQNLNQVLANSTLNIEHDRPLYLYFGNVIYCFSFNDDIVENTKKHLDSKIRRYNYD